MNVALVSVKGAPGVTTLACALGAAWPSTRDVVVLEGDPAGGDMAARFALPGEPGMAAACMSLRHHSTCSLADFAQELPGGLQVVVGAAGADAAGAVDRELELVGLDALDGGPDIVVDCGRFVPGAGGQRRILASADAVFVVLRADGPSVIHGRALVGRLLDGGRVPGRDFGVVVTMDGPFDASDVADAVGAPLVESIPWDVAAAAAFRGEHMHPRALARSPLVRSAARLALTTSLLATDERLRDAS
ncbi:MAG: hypothetical protein ACYDD4_02325 [Acidimicrobiales bacterium]